MNNKISPNIRIGNPNIKGNDYLLINKCLGSLFDQGKSSLISFLFMLLITYVRYSSLLSPLALAVCTIENNLANQIFWGFVTWGFKLGDKLGGLIIKK